MFMMMPALRYRQGERTMYLTAGSPQALVKFIQAPRLYDPRKPEDTGNRPVDKAHVAGIVRYLEDEPKYVIGAVTLYVRPNTVRFESHDPAWGGDGVALGNLLVPVDTKFDIGDGQHRLRAYEEIMRARHDDEHDPILKRIRESGTPVIIVEEADAARTAQDFVDLQRNAKPLSSSLGAALDRRLAVNRLALELATSLPLLTDSTPGDRIEYLSQTVSKLSPRMYSFASWRFAIGTAILGFGQRARRSWEQAAEARLVGSGFDDWRRNLREAFELGTRTLPGWKDVLAGDTTVPSFREHYVLGTSAGLTAFAGMLHHVVTSGGDVPAAIQRAGQIDWLKEPRDGQTPFFEGTIVREGRVLSYRPAFEAAADRLTAAVAPEAARVGGAA